MSYFRHPCIFGDCSQSTRFRDAVWAKGLNRWIEGMRDNNLRWVEETDSDRRQLKNYDNCEFPPLVASSNPNGHTLVLEMVPIAELHTILLNPVNHLVKSLEEASEASGVGVEEVRDWLLAIGVRRAAYQAKSFEGKHFKNINRF
jgi:hypothetical protein